MAWCDREGRIIRGVRWVVRDRATIEASCPEFVSMVMAPETCTLARSRTAQWNPSWPRVHAYDMGHEGMAYSGSPKHIDVSLTRISSSISVGKLWNLKLQASQSPSIPRYMPDPK